MSRYRGGPPTTLYVRNISSRSRYDDLKCFFQQYGKILDITIPLDYYSGMPKGYCFIEYEDPRDAEEAQYRLDRKLFFGKEIDVEFARGIRQTATDMRQRDRRHEPYYGRRDDERMYERDYDRGYSRRSRSRSREERRSSGSRRSRAKIQATGRSRSPRERSLTKSRSESRHRSPSPPAQHRGRSVSRDSRDRSPKSDSRD